LISTAPLLAIPHHQRRSIRNCRINIRYPEGHRLDHFRSIWEQLSMVRRQIWGRPSTAEHRARGLEKVSGDQVSLGLILRDGPAGLLRMRVAECSFARGEAGPGFRYTLRAALALGHPALPVAQC